MNWVKKNPAKLFLAIVAVLLLGGAYVLYSGSSEFPEQFKGAQVSPIEDNKIPPTDLAAVTTAQTTLTAAPTWVPKVPENGDAKKSPASAFKARKLILNGGELMDIEETDRPLHPPLTNAWIRKYAPALDITDGTIKDLDPDNDGFSNLLEFYGKDGKDGGDDSTDPTKADSHPPYFTRIVITEVRQIAFRLQFKVYDIDATNPANTSVFVNPIDRGNTSKLVKIGELIPGTRYKVIKVEQKITKDAEGIEKDVSELTVQNTETGTLVILPLDKVVNSPDSFIVIDYLWQASGGVPHQKLSKRKNDTFKLPPLDGDYKVLDIKKTIDEQTRRFLPGKALILAPTGEVLLLTEGVLLPEILPAGTATIP